MAPKRVLLVDDEPNLLRLLAAVLRSSGLDVSTVADAGAALAAAAANDIDVLVTDVSLEGMDGVALASTLVERRPGLLVVFMSGYSMDLEAVRRKVPHCAFLEKPFPPRSLAAAIADLAARG